MHARKIILADLRILLDDGGRNIHSVFSARRFQEMGRSLVAEPARTEMHANPNAVLLIGKNIDIMISAADRAQLLCCRRLSDRAAALDPTLGSSNKLVIDPRLTRSGRYRTKCHAQHHP